jgi:hypothetical protein
VDSACSSTQRSSGKSSSKHSSKIALQRRGLDLGAGEANERLFIRKREGSERDGDAIGAWMACGVTEYEFGKRFRWSTPTLKLSWGIVMGY